MDILLYTLLFLICVSIFLYLRKSSHANASLFNASSANKSRHKKQTGKNSIQSFKPMIKINDGLNLTLNNRITSSASKLDETNESTKPAPNFPESFKLFEVKSQLDSGGSSEFDHMLSKIGKPHPLLSSLCLNTSDSKELLDVIKKDPELVAKVINVANSPLFGLSKPITNLNHAMMFLGIIEVKNIATNFAVKESLEFDNDDQRRIYEKIWSVGFLAGCIVVELAKELNVDNAAQLSTRCQLSYLGDLVVLFGKVGTTDLYSKQTDFLSRLDSIQQLYSVNQVVIASKLAENWGLPNQITESISKNLQPFKNELTGDELEKRNTLLSYISCRLAELLIFNENIDILTCKTLSWEDTQCIEFAHTQAQLKDVNLLRLNYVLNSVAFRRKMIQYTSELNKH